MLEFYGNLRVTIENIRKQIIPAVNFAIRLAIVNLRKLLDMLFIASYLVLAGKHIVSTIFPRRAVCIVAMKGSIKIFRQVPVHVPSCHIAP